MQSLAVGLVEETLGWKRLLEQEGIFWKVSDLKKTISEKDFAVIIANRELSAKEQDNLRAFVKKGGIVLKDRHSGQRIEVEGSEEKGFLGAGKCLPETVSLVDKGKIRRIFSSRLKHLFDKRGLPFVQKWFFPGKAKNVFAALLSFTR